MDLYGAREATDRQPGWLDACSIFDGRHMLALQCIEGCMKKLKELNKPFKYIGAPASPWSGIFFRIFAAGVGILFVSLLFLSPSLGCGSDGGADAEKRRGVAHCNFMLLGQHDRR